MAIKHLTGLQKWSRLLQQTRLLVGTKEATAETKWSNRRMQSIFEEDSYLQSLFGYVTLLIDKS